jgi:adenylylsulfate kinase
MATNVVWHAGVVDKEARYAMLKQRGATVWLTGLSGSGKSTVSVALEQALFGSGYLVYRLDGDNIRHGLNSDLGFSAADRTENIRRIAEVAKLMGDVGVVTATAFISPYAADRKVAREVHEKAGIPFVEVHVYCPLGVAETRDPKGLYKKARAGEIKNFTGIDDPFEAPENPEVLIDTSKQTVAECAKAILDYLVAEGFLMEKSKLSDVAEDEPVAHSVAEPVAKLVVNAVKQPEVQSSAVATANCK